MAAGSSSVPVEVEIEAKQLKYILHEVKTTEAHFLKDCALLREMLKEIYENANPLLSEEEKGVFQRALEQLLILEKQDNIFDEFIPSRKNLFQLSEEEAKSLVSTWSDYMRRPKDQGGLSPYFRAMGLMAVYQPVLIRILTAEKMKPFLEATQKRFHKQTKALTLDGFLIKPLQRLSKYSLLVRDIRKCFSSEIEDLLGVINVDSLTRKFTHLARVVNERVPREGMSMARQMALLRDAEKEMEYVLEEDMTHTVIPHVSFDEEQREKLKAFLEESKGRLSPNRIALLEENESSSSIDEEEEKYKKIIGAADAMFSLDNPDGVRFRELDLEKRDNIEGATFRKSLLLDQHIAAQVSAMEGYKNIVEEHFPGQSAKALSIYLQAKGVAVNKKFSPGFVGEKGPARMTMFRNAFLLRLPEIEKKIFYGEQNPNIAMTVIALRTKIEELKKDEEDAEDGVTPVKRKRLEFLCAELEYSLNGTDEEGLSIIKDWEEAPVVDPRTLSAEVPSSITTSELMSIKRVRSFLGFFSAPLSRSVVEILNEAKLSLGAPSTDTSPTDIEGSVTSLPLPPSSSS